MTEAGMPMTKQAYAMMNWGQLMEELDGEQLASIPAFLEDKPEGDGTPFEPEGEEDEIEEEPEEEEKPPGAPPAATGPSRQRP
jgi:hypothetical protein